MFQKKILISFLLIAMLTFSACTYNPLSENNHLTGNALSTAVGAAAGAGTAAALGATKPLPLATAALAGASVGYYVSTLRFAAAGIYQAGGQVFTQGDYLTIVIPTDDLFEDNSTELLPEAEPALQSAANVLKRFGCQNILISGNTSGFGTTKYEHRISEGRAKEVAAFLWKEGINQFQHYSITLRHLDYVGYGNYFPIATDLYNKGIRQNSRIQITAYPTKEQLMLDEGSIIFNNMAGIDEAHPPARGPAINLAERSNNSEVLEETATSRISKEDDP